VKTVLYKREVETLDELMPMRRVNVFQT